MTGLNILRAKAARCQQGVEIAPSMCHHMCGGSHMATNLSIDPDLLERALEVSGERTKKAAVTKALQEFIARRRQKRLLELIGKLEWDESYDYKAERRRK
jgi:Arc/MetJ family transcription regulator